MNNQAKDPVQSAYEMAVNAWNAFKNVPNNIKNWWNTPAVIELGGPSTSITPSPTPTPYQLGPLSPETKIFNPNISTSSAEPYIRNLVQGYDPSGKSVMIPYVSQMASVSGARQIDPRIMPGLTITENSLMDPNTAGYRMNNPFSAMPNGTLFKYPDIGTAIDKYGSAMAGPVWNGAWNERPAEGGYRWGSYAGFGPETTLREFLQKHNNEGWQKQEQDIINLDKQYNKYPQ